MYAVSPGPGWTSYALRSPAVLSSSCQLQPASLDRWIRCWPMVTSVFGSSSAATVAYVTGRSLPVVGASTLPSDSVMVTDPSPYPGSQCGRFQDHPGVVKEASAGRADPREVTRSAAVPRAR